MPDHITTLTSADQWKIWLRVAAAGFPVPDGRDNAEPEEGQ